MKKIILLVIVIAVSNYSQAQTKVPTIFPASPEASTLGKYGDIPVNLSTGNINYSVPIFTISEYEFSLPISLSYSYSGLLIDEVPGVTGLGWNLVGGGVITRQVRGRPDDDLYGYIGDNMIGQNKVIPYIDGTLTQNEEDNFLTLVYEGIRDSQPDKFMLNIAGVSASFYFDENKNPIILPYKPYKIEIIGNNLANGLKVTDDNGIQYFFEETEISKRLNLSLALASASSLNGHISGWKISKIVLLNEQEINFSYTPYIYKTKVFYESYDEVVSGNCTGSAFPSVANAQYEIRSKILEQITFPKGSIVFDIQSQAATEFNQYLAALEGIDILDYHGNEVSTFDLNYSSNDHTRKVLTEIIINNDDNNSYHFEYHAGSSPIQDIHYAKQDIWGYFNSNASYNLIDKNNINTNRIPDFSKSIAKALKTIHHPTKGTTEFTYEANTYDPGEGAEAIDDFSSCQNAPFNKMYSVGVGLGHWSPETSSNDVKTFEIIDATKFVSINLHVLKNNVMGDVAAGVRLIDGIPGTSNCNAIDCDPGKTCSYYAVSFCCGFVQPGNPLEEYKNTKVRLAPGVYEVYAEVAGGFIAEYSSLEASALVSVWDESLVAPGESPNRARETGGIRIAQVTSCPDDSGEGCLIKKYTYENEEGISEGHLFKRRDLFSYNTVHNNGGTCNKTQYSSSSNLPLTFSGSHIIYKNVKEESVDALGNTNGSRIVSFQMQPPTNTEEYPFPPLDRKEWRNGLVKTEKIMNNTGTLLSKTDNGYQLTTNLNLPSSDEARGFVVGRQSFNYWPAGTWNLTFNPNDLTIAHTNFNAGQDVSWLNSQTDSTYYSNGESISTSTSYEYTNPEGHVKAQVSTNSDGISLRSENEYAYEIAAPIPEALTALNRIANPLQTKDFQIDLLENEKLLSSKKTGYHDFGIILPDTIQTAKGEEPMEDNIIYHQYDSYGHPLELSQANGRHTSYIRGYQNTLPVAKLEGVHYNEIDPASISDIQTFSNLGMGSESDLLDELDNLQDNNPLAMITTYTYKPLIGVSTITDPSGRTTSYEYDEHNRLRLIRDSNQNIIEEYSYHISEQPADPLNAAIAYGTNDIDHQWFYADYSGGSGNFTISWFEWVGPLPTDFENTPSGTGVSYQLMVDCSETESVKMVAEDNVTGDTIEVTKVNNNGPCPSLPLTVTVVRGSHTDTYQNFTTMVNGGSGDVSYAWYEGIDNTQTYSFNVAGNLPNFQMDVSCSSSGRYAKVIVTDNVTGLTAEDEEITDNSPCSGGGGNPGPGPQPLDPEGPQQ